MLQAFDSAASESDLAKTIVSILPSNSLKVSARGIGFLSELNLWAYVYPAVATPNVLPRSAYDSGPAYLAKLFTVRLSHSLLQTGLSRRFSSWKLTPRLVTD